jgi:iron uptake system EfeUOB component EfeO/EfeM
MLLAAGACGGGADGAAADGQQQESASVSERSAGHPLLPMPEPPGERSIGARIWEYQIEVTKDTVPAGEIEFHVVNAGTTEHWLIVRDDTLFEGTPHLLPGDSAVLRVTLQPGEYNLVCTIRDEFDHISEGEREFLVVR